MIEAKDNDMVITREDGTEDLWKIYFYYVEEESGKTFYFLYKEEDPDSLIVMASLDGKELRTGDSAVVLHSTDMQTTGIRFRYIISAKSRLNPG